jgi:hypothetical protein
LSDLTALAVEKKTVKDLQDSMSRSGFFLSFLRLGCVCACVDTDVDVCMCLRLRFSDSAALDAIKAQLAVQTQGRFFVCRC